MSVSDLGCHIYYSYSNSLESTGNNNYALLVNNCTFSINTGSTNGGSIIISILDKEQAGSIDINACTFTGNNENTGCSIYYEFGKSSTLSRTLLEKIKEGENMNYALNVNGCTFNENKASSFGSSINILIEKGENLKPIRINDCEFNLDDQINRPSINYLFNSALNNAPNINNPSLQVVACNFTRKGETDIMSKKQSYITLSIKNGEPSGSIEINNCQFESNKAESGCDIYYDFSPSSPSSNTGAVNNYALHVTDSKFTNNKATNNGGSIFITISNSEPSKPIEINTCNFDLNFAFENDKGSDVAKPENGGAIYYIIIKATSRRQQC